jgi:D-alanine-D-alanine ligase
MLVELATEDASRLQHLGAGARRRFDYQSKYQLDGAQEVFPAIAESEAKTMHGHALHAQAVLKLGSFSRIDFRCDDQNRLWCLEANSLPGMTPTSLSPQAAKAAGIEFPELLERICRGAVRNC